MASAKAMADFAFAHVGEPYDLSAIMSLHFSDDDDEGTEPSPLADDGEWICFRLADMRLRDTEALHRAPLPAAFTIVHPTWRTCSTLQSGSPPAAFHRLKASSPSGGGVPAITRPPPAPRGRGMVSSQEGHGRHLNLARWEGCIVRIWFHVMVNEGLVEITCKLVRELLAANVGVAIAGV